MRETVLFLDQTAEAAIEEAAALLAQHPVTITHRTPFSVAFTGSPTEASPGPRTVQVEEHSAGKGLLPPGGGQMAAVPLQVRPEWCWLWITVNGPGAAAAAAEAFMAARRKRSRVVQAEVRHLEGKIYGEAEWETRAAGLRANLARSGLDPATIEARLAAFKERWLALGRKAIYQGPEEPPLA